MTCSPAIQKQNAGLRSLIQHRLAVLRKQKRVLDWARLEAWGRYCQAKKVTGRPSGVKRHVWAAASGQLWAAGKVYFEILIYDYAKGLLEED